MASRQLFNARTQQLELADLTVDNNNEIVATFADGGFIKFPAGLTSDQFEALVVEHQAINVGQEVITPESEAAQLAERDNSLELINKFNEKEDATSEEVNQSNDQNSTPQEQQPVE